MLLYLRYLGAMKVCVACFGMTHYIVRIYIY